MVDVNIGDIVEFKNKEYVVTSIEYSNMVSLLPLEICRMISMHSGNMMSGDYEKQKNVVDKNDVVLLEKDKYIFQQRMSYFVKYKDEEKERKEYFDDMIDGMC